MTKNRKFCVLFITRNYYPFFKECLYKYSKANWDDVLVLNTDLDSTTDNLKDGIKVCEELGIKHIGSVGCTQGAIKLADEYLTENNIDVNWIMYFEHDVVPLQEDFWDRVDEAIESIDGIDDKVGMFGANSVLYVSPDGTTDGGGSYDYGLKMLGESDFDRRKNGTASARGNLVNGIHEWPHAGWYRILPDEYYKTDYYVVEVPNWTCSAFNRKVFRESIVVDEKFIFNLWADDLAHQYLYAGYINISFNDLMVAHDLNFSKPINIHSPSDMEWKRKAGNPHERFIEKWGWDWGVRNRNVRTEFNMSFTKYIDKLQNELFMTELSDGPKKIEDFIK